MFDSLRRTLDLLYPVSDADWTLFCSCLQIKRYLKNEPLLQAGQVCKGISFVNTGAFRSYVLKDGREVNTRFSFETHFVTDYESLTKQQPCSLTIVALEPAETVYFRRDELIELYQQAPNIVQLGRVLLENVVIQQSQYTALFTLYSPTERYEYLHQHYPLIVQRVPLQHIASYLGMARETLSRIRKKK